MHTTTTVNTHLYILYGATFGRRVVIHKHKQSHHTIPRHTTPTHTQSSIHIFKYCLQSLIQPNCCIASIHSHFVDESQLYYYDDDCYGFAGVCIHLCYMTLLLFESDFHRSHHGIEVLILQKTAFKSTSFLISMAYLSDGQIKRRSDWRFPFLFMLHRKNKIWNTILI